MDIKKIIPVMAIAIFGTSNYEKTVQAQDNDPTVILIPPHKSPDQQFVSVNYNQATTQLNVVFCAEQGGKVEIYRNGTLVVGTNAPAGASLSYVLSNYGRGNYTVVVSCGKTVVYYGNHVVK